MTEPLPDAGDPAGPAVAKLPGSDPIAPETLAEILSDRLPYRIVRPYRVRFEEAAADESTRTAIYLAWAADVAWQHSTLLGFGRDWYSQRGLIWLVRSVRLDVHKPVWTNSTVLVTTQVTGYRRIAAHRHCEVRDASGELLAGLEIDWVMTNQTGVPTRVPDQMLHFVADPLATFEMFKLALPPTPPDAAERRFSVCRRDLDPMGHVNNSVYIDYLEESLEAAGQGRLIAATPRRYEIEFVASAERDKVLVSRTWPTDAGWAYWLGRDDGTEVFRARVSLI